MTFTSHAKWPTGAGINLGNTENESTDTHGDRESAETVCRMLQERGFGGDGQMFPLRTWVTSDEDEQQQTKPNMTQHITIEAQKRQAVNDIRDPHEKHGPDRELLTFSCVDVELIITADEFEEYLQAVDLTWEAVREYLDGEKLEALLKWCEDEGILHAAAPEIRLATAETMHLCHQCQRAFNAGQRMVVVTLPEDTRMSLYYHEHCLRPDERDTEIARLKQALEETTAELDGLRVSINRGEHV